MAGFNIIPDLTEFNNLANLQGAEYWLSLGINLIIATIVGGIVLILVMVIYNKRYGGATQPGKIFFVVLIINFLTFFGLLGAVLPVIAMVPFGGLILPWIIWVIVLTLAFPDTHFLHNIILGLIFVLLTVTLVSSIVSLITAAI